MTTQQPSIMLSTGKLYCTADDMVLKKEEYLILNEKKIPRKIGFENY